MKVALWIAIVGLVALAVFQQRQIQQLSGSTTALGNRVVVAESKLAALEKAASTRSKPETYELARDLEGVKADLEFRFVRICARTQGQLCITSDTSK